MQHCFAAKADLLRASAHLLRQEIERHVRAALRDADGPADTLRRALLAVVELGARAPVLLLARGLADGVLVGEPGVTEAAALLDHQLGRIGLPAFS
ncbi:hypothetical protein [Streptosporangium carneum]|uniref:hypothetical protein n=1 Tax=Streptosporangium carneum TaxID=47481 RepID=UPI0022F2E33E|nr:hypothetical protein [Streptosporangium carneum]